MRLGCNCSPAKRCMWRVSPGKSTCQPRPPPLVPQLHDLNIRILVALYKTSQTTRPGQARQAMEERRSSPEYTLDIFADRACVKDIVKAILHTIFFHRYFTPLRPHTHDLLDVTFPYVQDVDLETLVEQRANTLVRQLDASSDSSTSGGFAAAHGHQAAAGQRQRGDGGRAQVVVQFMEKKRRKGWFGAKADEEMVWETWILDVTLASPRTEVGM